MFYVYGYFEPGVIEPFYIGKGSGTRMYVHLTQSLLTKKTTLFYNKLNKMLTDRIYPIVRIIIDNLTEKEAFKLEIKLIKQYGRRDLGTGCLCNHTDGGEGPTGYLHTDESKAKMSLGQKTRETPSIDTRIKLAHTSLGRKHSDASKQHMSQIAIAAKGMPVESFNLKTGITIKQYDCISSVRKDGYHPTHVAKVAKGYRQHHHYLGWRYY